MLSPSKRFRDTGLSNAIDPIFQVSLFSNRVKIYPISSRQYHSTDILLPFATVHFELSLSRRYLDIPPEVLFSLIIFATIFPQSSLAVDD